MPRNGSGTFNLAEPPFVPLTIIDAGDMNNVLSDMGVALTQSFSRDGQTIATGAWNLGNFRITNLATPILTNDAATKGYVDGRTAWEVIGSTVPTATGNIDFTWNAGVYRSIDIILTGILPAAAGGSINLLARARRFGAYLTGASDYQTVRNVANFNGVAGDEVTASAWYLQDDGTNAALTGLSGRLTLDLAESANEPSLLGLTRYTGVAGGRRVASIAGSLSDGALDGIRFLWEGAGNFAAVGRIVVLGLRADATAGGSPTNPATVRVLQFACGDETTAIAAPATDLITLRAPYAFTLQEVRASLTGACTTGTFGVDVLLNGSSIFSTTLTIDATETTSVTAAVPAVLSTVEIADDDVLTVDVLDEGDGTATGLKVALIGVAS